MFQFTGFAPLTWWYVFNIPGCPIRIPADHIICADPRSFSQLITSFIASESLGIHHTPFISFLCFLLFYLLLFYIFLYIAYKKVLPFLCFWFLRYHVSNMSMNFNSKLESLRVTPAVLTLKIQSWKSFKRICSGEYRSRTDDLLRARQAL